MSDSGFELVMPFLPVQSKGGPYDDLAYTAGFEMGKLDTALSVRENHQQTLSITIHRDNHEQADLIAMRHGYTTELHSQNDHGWLCLILRPGSKP